MEGAIGFDISKFSGALYYSKKQWKELRNRGSLRTFALLADGKQVVEYTEMITYDNLMEDPDMKPLFDDSGFVGYGIFAYHLDINNKMVKVPII